MDQPGGVGVVRGLGDLGHHRREGRGAGPLGLEHLGQVAALDVLEDDEDLALAVPADVVDPDDPRVGQPGGDSGLGQERLDLPRVAEHARVEDLDRHRPAELLVAREEDACRTRRAPSTARTGYRPNRSGSGPAGRTSGGTPRGCSTVSTIPLPAGSPAAAAGRDRRSGAAGVRSVADSKVSARRRRRSRRPSRAGAEVILGRRAIRPPRRGARSRSPAARGAAARAAAGRRPRGTPRSADRRRRATGLEPLARRDDAGESGDFERRGILGLQRVHRASPPGLPRSCDPMRSRVPPHRPADPPHRRGDNLVIMISYADGGCRSPSPAELSRSAGNPSDAPSGPDAAIPKPRERTPTEPTERPATPPEAGFVTSGALSRRRHDRAHDTWSRRDRRNTLEIPPKVLR